jgi:RNA polymerase sigma-70 factor (ECF subfamily)
MTPALDARHAAFEQLAGEVLEPVRRYLARRTDPATADDVLGDVLLVLWRRLEDVPPEPLPWAYGVARLSLANASRGSRRQQRLAGRLAAVDPPRESVPEPAVSPAEDQVRPALAQLRPAEAELLRLWAWEELTAGEISTVLGISTNAVNIRLHRARERFKDALRKLPEDPGHEQVNERRRT